jgi:superfamily I DNA/RNA helicase
MQQVFLTHASMRTIYGQQRMQIPSEFITEMSPEHISSDTSIMPSDSRDTQGEKIVYLDIDL